MYFSHIQARSRQKVGVPAGLESCKNVANMSNALPVEKQHPVELYEPVADFWQVCGRMMQFVSNGICMMKQILQ